MKVALAFFGITRSLKYTIDSIHKSFFDVFKRKNIEYDIFLHTYNITNYCNVRTGEKVDDKDINNDEYKLLNANYVETDDQETIKKKLNLKSYRTHKDPWKTDYNSVDNFILGSYSKFQVTNMIEKTGNNYDFIIFIRPDCFYFQDFNKHFFQYIRENCIVMPNFHLYGKHKVNDRFAITNMNTYKIYGKIFTELLEKSKKQPLHSESILGQHLHNNKIQNIKIKFKFARVRFNGLVEKDFQAKLGKRLTVKDEIS